MIRSHSKRVAAGVVIALLALASVAHADMSGIRIEQIGWADRAGDANTQLVQLVATTPDQTRDAELHLEVTGVLGSVTDNLIAFGANEGAAWPQGGRWLVAGTSFASKVGLARDGAIAKLDAVGGTMTLWTYDSTGTRVDLDTFTWGTAAGVARPPYNGQALVRTATGFTTVAHPTLTNSSGGHVTDTAYGYDPQTMWTIAEAFLDCANATSNVRYLQLRSNAAGFFDSRLVLRISDGTGKQLGLVKPFTAVNGVTFASGANWLSASSAFQTATALAPDLVLTVIPSNIGGTVELMISNAVGDSLRTLQTLRYGITGGADVPAKGLALQRQNDGNYLAAIPAPITRSGATPAASGCLLQAGAAAAWHVREVGFDCADHIPGLWFLALAPDYVQPPGVDIGVRLLDHLGATLLTIPQLGADSHKPAFLLASQAFVTTTGFAADRIADTGPDPLGGRIQITVTNASGVSVVQELYYGGVSGAAIGTPVPGGSIKLVAGTYTLTTSATPMRSDGTIAQSDCFLTADASLVRLDQLGLRCATGTAKTEYIMLRAINGAALIDHRFGVRAFDRNGALIGDLGPSFLASQIDLNPNQPYLIAGANFVTTGLSPDLTLPFELDQAGGHVQVYRARVDGGETILSDVDYSGAHHPFDGTALARQSDIDYVLTTSPAPQNSAGVRLSTTTCYGGFALSNYRLDEFGTGCHTSATPVWFMALRTPLESPSNSPLMRLRLRNRFGVVLFQRDSLGQQSNGRDFLVASPGFAAQTGLQPDLTIDSDVDTLGGRIEFVRLISGAEVPQTDITYGLGATLPSPTAGGSLIWNGSRYVTQLAATPSRSDGKSVVMVCGPPSDAFRLSEIAVRCHAGTPNTAFIELESVGADAMIDGRLGLQCFNASGQIVGDLSIALRGAAGTLVRSGRHILIAPSTFSSLGPTPDLLLTFALDTLGGRVTLTRSHDDGSVATLSEVRYGAGGIALPAGRSLSSDANGLFSANFATPRNLAGGTLTNDGCYDIAPPPSWLIEEIGMRCADGSPASFIQAGTVSTFDITSDFGLLVQDSTGRNIADLPHFFAPLAGAHFVPGQHILIGGAAFASYPGGHVDLSLPLELDPRAGAVVIYRDPAGNSAQRFWLATLPYGTTRTPAPPPGKALLQTTAGAFSLVGRVQPIDLSGTPRLTHCYVPRDTSVRIYGMATMCYAGTPNYGYVALTSLVGGAWIEPGLAIRTIDGQGRLVEDHPITSPAVVGTPWKEDVYSSPIRIFGTPNFGKGSYQQVLDSLTSAPAPDSGAIELYYRDPENGSVTLLDRWEYGSLGHIAAPRRGEALIRSDSGVVVAQASQFGGGSTYGSYCGRPDVSGIGIGQILLQCVDGSLSGQYVQLWITQRQVLDPYLGIIAKDRAGNVLFDRRDLFGARTWQTASINSAFLCAPAEAAARVGDTPDLLMPAPLDTSGGSVSVYYLASDGTRRILSTKSYGNGSPLPPPGCGLIPISGTFAQNTVAPYRFPLTPWPLTGCTLATPAIQLSEISSGCSFEPRDAGGAFVELRANGDVPLTGTFSLDLGNGTTTPIFVGGPQMLHAGQNWLVSGTRFPELAGLTPDEMPWTGLRNIVYSATLLWAPGAHYAPVPIDKVTAPANGSSTQRLANGATTIGFADPHNALGEGLSPNSCFSNGVISPPMVVYSFSPGCHAGGASTAFVCLLTMSKTGLTDMRLRITGHDGATLCELPDVFGSAPLPTATTNLWLVGAIGFQAGAAYKPDVELPIRFDPAGGEVTLYRTQPNGVDYVASRIRYPALDFGSGVQRDDFFNSFPAPVPVVTSVLPQAGRNSTGVWTNFGETYGQGTRLMSAGSTCADGSTTSDFVELSFPFDIPSSCHALPSTCIPFVANPAGGWVRTLDSHGALLDSVQIFSGIVRPMSTAGLGGTYARSLYAATGVLADAEKLPADRAPRMDPIGGTLQFVMMRPDGKPAEIADTRTYGAAPTGSNPLGAFFGSPPRVAACSPCGTHAFVLGLNRPFVHSTQPQFGWSDAPASSGGTGTQIAIDGSNARTSIASASGSAISLLTSTEFRLNGGASATPVTIRARLLVQGTLTWRYSAASAEGADLLVTLDGDHPVWKHRQWTSSTAAGPQNIRDTVEVLVTVAPNTPFRLGLIYRNSSPDFSSTAFNANWVFADVPPGMTVTSCHGYGGAPVPTALALANAQAFDDRIELEWMGGEPNTRYTLERQSVGDGAALTPWLPLATVLADGGQHVSYHDAAVRGGATYAYRLRGSDGSLTAETRVSVPDPARLSLAIVGAQPVHGALEFAITRPGAAPAKLELFDIAGRLIAHREFAAGGEVRAQCKLDTGTARAGVFLARLRCAGDQRIVRVVRTP